MRSIDTARNVLAIMEHDGAKPSFHELSKALDAIEAELADHYVELPVDADGEHIHIGDVMEFTDGSTDEDGNKTFIVGGFDSEFPQGRGRLLVADDDNACWYPDQLRHHHPPTVEDVLREFADLVRKERIELATVSEGTIAEYAKRLRLAEGEDE